MATSKLLDDNELKCGICLKLFQDPRSLPCLHTFCLECIKGLLGSSHSLKCSVCRAEHELSDQEVQLLPVDRDVFQKLPTSWLKEQEGNGKCTSCEEEAELVAWCEQCGIICRSCLNQHKKMQVLRGHHIVENTETAQTIPSEQKSMIICCLKHVGQELKYLCTLCSELVCPECLLVGSHKDHKYSLVEEARHSLESKMEELVSLAATKKEEFSEYLEKASKAEDKALEHSELMKSEVNNVFDCIEASVKAQRNDALQSVSKRVKEIWAQKEMVEVSLAQLDSFTRFADRTHQCLTDADYVAMAILGIKLMEQLKNTYGDEDVLAYKFMAMGSLCSMGMRVPLDEVFTVRGQPSLQFVPVSESNIGINNAQFFNFRPNSVKISVKVLLVVDRLPMIGRNLSEKCHLDVEMFVSDKPVPFEVNVVSGSSWEITTDAEGSWMNCDLEIKCRLSGELMAVEINEQAKYSIVDPF